MKKTPLVFSKQQVSRLFHNLLSNIVFPRTRGRDNVVKHDKFYLYHIFLKLKISLPSLILNHCIGCAKQRDFTKVTIANSIPYAILFTMILKLHDLDKSTNLRRIEIYSTSEEITKVTFNKMHIPDQFSPLSRRNLW